ncbi:PIN domain-containing protein [Candidatus Saccharibacteria bacterium]|nr:PIN domain-containing protein [Candidatus Saccharibacteria bacterium]
MICLIDTNVPLDLLLGRPSADNADRILSLCSQGKITGYFTAVSYPTVANLLASAKASASDVQRVLNSLATTLRYVELTENSLANALDAPIGDFGDFEDAMQVQAAQQIRATYIITNNVEHFKNSPVPAVTPATFLRIYRMQQNPTSKRGSGTRKAPTKPKGVCPPR